MSLLKLENIGKIYTRAGSIAVGIRGASLSFDIGEFVAVTGKSGSGKTTLLNVIGGIDSYEEGELYISGEPTSHYSEDDWEKYREEYISFVFQDYNIIESFTVLQNVELALSDKYSSSAERRRRALELINKVGLTQFCNHKGSKLSGGQKQRTVIARALAKDSPIILADEPTGNLDSATAKEIILLLKEISKEKLVIIVTHNFDEVAEHATREIRIFDGAVERDSEISASEISEYQRAPLKNTTKTDVLKRSAELGMHRFKAMPKLSVFMSIILIVAMLGAFLVTSLFATDISIFDKNQLFTPYDGRLVVTRKDGKPIEKDEFQALIDNTSAIESLRYDSLLEAIYSLEIEDDDELIACDFVYSYDKLENITPDIGRAPESSDEVMLVMPIYFKPIYGEKELKIEYQSFFDGAVRYKISGIKYYYDNSLDGKLIFTREGLEEISKYAFVLGKDMPESLYSMGYAGADVSFGRNGSYNGSYYYNPAIAIDPELKGAEFYLVGSAAKDYDELVLNNDFNCLINYTRSSSSGNGVGGELGDIMGDIPRYRKDLADKFDISELENNNGYMGYDGYIYFSPDFAEKVTTLWRDGSYRQCSLFFENDREASSANEKLQKEGYRCVLSSATFDMSIMRMLEVIGDVGLLVIWLMFILFLGFFISFCTSKIIVKMRGDLSIMRSMGIKVNVIKKSTYFHMLYSSIPALILMIIVPFVIYTVPSLNYIFPFMHLFQYILIVAGTAILYFYLTRRYNNKIFDGKVKDGLMGGDDNA